MTLEEERQSRQWGPPPDEDEEDDIDPETATINPHTLPQVAALLGAIFSGNLNLTNVVDKAFHLVPDTVRNQVTGLFGILGGSSSGSDSSIGGGTSGGVAPIARPTAPAFIPHPLDTTLTPLITNDTNTTHPGFEIERSTTTEKQIEQEIAAFGSVFVPRTTPPGGNKEKNALLSKGSILPIAEVASYDDEFNEEELRRAEEQVIEYARAYEPFVKEREPRFSLEPLRLFLLSTRSVNFTAIVKVMPDLFKGAREAFVLLENLGDVVTGDAELEDLNLEGLTSNEE